VEQAAQGDRQDEQVDQQQVQGECPGRALDVPLVDVLDHHHLELSREEDGRQHRQPNQREPLLVGEPLARPLGKGEQLVQLGDGAGALEDVARAVEDAPGHEDADGQEGER
jgi:hypothetical protein